METTSSSLTEIVNAFEEVVPSFLSVSVAASSSAHPPPTTYFDVFINHCGPDVKYPLATNICHKLTALGISVFLDAHSLQLGDDFPAHIQQAMRTASLHLAIFSPNYANSPWCLAELSFMLKTGNKIIPVFYHVDPADLRWVAKGKGKYAPAFCQHEEQQRYSCKRVEEWKAALEKVSSLNGFVVKDSKDEGMLLKNIVNMVTKLLGKVPLLVAQNPIGLDDVVVDFERSTLGSAQNEKNVQIVGIVGMGGVGKTTLAKELYNRKSSSFQSCSFVFAVRDAASRNALHEKQKKLLQDIGLNGLDFDDIEEGKSALANRLRSVRALIVLDDVDHKIQLDALLPSRDCLGSGSLVIVTTRELNLLAKWGSVLYRMKGLNPFHAKELFCWHAFSQCYPQEGFEDMVEEFLGTCNGLPLSLEVFGGLVYGRSRDYWESQLHKISRLLPEDIKGRLSVSYNALDEEEKEMFMDVACFFIGGQMSWAIDVWDGSGWSGLHGWETLVNKCLVKMDEHNKIAMHDHLRDLGRDLARRHSPSRVWLPKNTINIEKQARLISRGLQLFTGRKTKFIKDFATPSEDLIWLRVLDFKKRKLPSWLSLRKLRYLKLYDAVNLRELWSDTDNPPEQLRELLIEDAYILKRVPTSIGRLKEVKRIDLCFCKSIKNLPEEFCLLSSLEWLQLINCEMLSSLPSRFGDLTNLRHINLHYCKRLQSLPVSFKQLRRLQYLNLCLCEQLRFRLDMLENMQKLEYLDFSFCRNLVELPNRITDQVYLRELHVDYTSLREVPDTIGQLQKLETLEIGSNFLKSLPSSIGNLTSLSVLAINGNLVTSFPPSLENLSSLTELYLHGPAMFNSVPEFLERLNMLKKIDIRRTDVSRISLPEDCCPSLETLILSFNNDLTCIESLPRSLQTIELVLCERLKNIKGITGLINLRSLCISDCTDLDEPSSFVDLHSIKDISIIRCDKFLKALTSWESRGMQIWEDVEKLKTLQLAAKKKSALQPCIQTIKKWPRQTFIFGRAASSVESVMESLSFPNLTVNREREGLLEFGKTHASDAAIVCIVIKMFVGHRIDHSFLPFSTRTQSSSMLTRGKWVFVYVLRQGCSLIDILGDIVHRNGKVKSIKEVVGEEERVMVMVGEEERVLQAFTNLWSLFR
ncbi:disease resistance protein RPV1 isoform X2 [Cryptomeria japonica]|uniref:disease resistance protein RPV1 isoform X2 n=1 Tax=Cryptomeria japonica TaxID=3369 RepID=UPI0027DA75D2|nr:disease resistance protein RPV1 isoform X2 [Cryptomeria japonica]